jgi:hypothetical protein
MALIAVGFLNYHIPKDQMQEIVECGQREEMCVRTVQMKNRVSRGWYIFLAMIALIGSIIYFSKYLCTNLLWVISHQRMIIGATEITLLIILFFIIIALFLHAPFIGERKAVREIEERCRIQYGVIIIFSE